MRVMAHDPLECDDNGKFVVTVVHKSSVVISRPPLWLGEGNRSNIWRILH